MKPVLREIIIVIVCLILGYAISKFVLTNIRGSEYNARTYNCDMAEFHPDYPPEVKQKCRELRNENRTSK
jgi:hypothetical protein